MSGPRYDHILASTALALILAAPVGALAQAPTNASASTQAPAGEVVPSTAAPAADTASAAPPPSEAVSKGTPAAPSQAPAASKDTPVAPSAAPAESKDTAAVPSQAPAGSKDAPAATPPAPANAAVATEPAAAPDPLAALDPADRPVAEKIRDLFAAKPDKALEKIFPSKKMRAAVEAFYQNRIHAPLWLEKGVESARATAVIARLNAAEAEGLDPKDYKVPNFAGLTPDALAEAELKLTETVLTYARHLQAGRFPFTRVAHNNIELPQAPPDAMEVLTKIADAADAGKALEQFSPPQEEYKKLKGMLAELRAKGGGPGKQIPDGPPLKLSKTPMQDPRVPLLREKLGLSGDASDLNYDAKLAEAVKKFQRANELPANGVLDAKTIKELNGPPRDKQIDVILANMERWRWYPRDLGAAHVILNQPDYSLTVMHNGAKVWSTRVVIGKTSMQTPLLSETMKYITLNPTWNVPPSIVYNEYLPALQQDPTVLERMGLKVVNNRDGSVHIYQPPGAGNALGRIRFNFPNRFLVYQHDTPDKYLFGHDARAYSHGCMRVQDPDQYAQVLFKIARPNENWTADKVKKMYGGPEQDIQLPVPIWVHLTYQSAFVDDAGKLQIRRDIYNLDSRTLAAIKSERGMVEPIQERKREPEVASSGGQRRAAVAPQRTVSFFEALFGGGGSFQPKPQPPRRIPR